MTEIYALTTLQDALRAQLEALRNYIPPTTGGQIRTGGQGTMRHFIMPDETLIKGTEDNSAELNAVILDWVWVNRWDKTGFKAGVVSQPSCMAFSRTPTGMIPVKDRLKTQEEKHTDCDTCQMNQWGSHRMGGKGKDCKNGALVAIVPVDAEANTTPWLIKISPTGITGFSNYLNRLRNAKGLIPLQVVTRISFKPGTEYATLIFGDEQPHQKLEMMMNLQKTAAATLEENLTK
jgi:hypothetical protein